MLRSGVGALSQKDRPLVVHQHQQIRPAVDNLSLQDILINLVRRDHAPTQRLVGLPPTR